MAWWPEGYEEVGGVQAASQDVRFEALGVEVATHLARQSFVDYWHPYLPSLGVHSQKARGGDTIPSMELEAISIHLATAWYT